MKVDTETVYRLVGGLASSKVLVVMLSSFLPSEVEVSAGKIPALQLPALCLYCVPNIVSSVLKVLHLRIDDALY